jgi:hypothetical protein
MIVIALNVRRLSIALYAVLIIAGCSGQTSAPPIRITWTAIEAPEWAHVLGPHP